MAELLSVAAKTGDTQIFIMLGIAVACIVVFFVFKNKFKK